MTGEEVGAVEEKEVGAWAGPEQVVHVDVLGVPTERLRAS